MSNVLLILVDQWPARHFSYRGGPFRTPSVDRIAARGASFDNAFTSCPLCTPARGALLSGRWPEQTRIYDNYSVGYAMQPPMSLEVPTWVDGAVSSGMFTGYFGKWHLGPHGPALRGAHRTSAGVDAGRLPYSPDKPGAFSYEQALAQRDRRQAKLVEGRAPFWGVIDTPTKELPPCQVVRDGIRFLNEFAETRPSHSFFLTVSITSPHFPHYLSRELAKEARDLEPVTPESLHDPLELRPWWHGRPWWPSMDTTVISEEEWRTAIQFGYRHAMAVDESIGMLLDALDDNRLADDTYVFFVADHGDMGGAHGRFDKGAYFYEEVWRIPLIVAGPAISESVRHEFVSILDVGATLSSLSGATRERVSRRDGRSLLPMTVESANGQLGAADAETFPQLAFGRYDLYNGMSFAVRSVRDERYTYVWNPQDVDELYDNDDDPAQLSNRIHDPSLRPVRIRLRAELDAFMEDTFDDLSRRASELPAAGTIVATGRPGP